MVGQALFPSGKVYIGGSIDQIVTRFFKYLNCCGSAQPILSPSRIIKKFWRSCARPNSKFPNSLIFPKWIFDFFINIRPWYCVAVMISSRYEFQKSTIESIVWFDSDSIKTVALWSISHNESYQQLTGEQQLIQSEIRQLEIQSNNVNNNPMIIVPVGINALINSIRCCNVESIRWTEMKAIERLAKFSLHAESNCFKTVDAKRYSTF